MSVEIGWFEGDNSYPDVPEWAKWFINAGYGFPVPDDDAERILIITTPCDSPAAALVSLGVVLRDLTREDATNVTNHARAIRAWARKNRDGWLWHLPDKGNRKAFEVDSIDSDGTLTLAEKSGDLPVPSRKTRQRQAPVTWKFGEGLTPDDRLLEFAPNGWPSPQSPTDRIPLSKGTYSWVLDNWQPVEQRLRESYTGACFAGRKSGEKQARELLSAIGFTVSHDPEEKGQRYGIDAMLTIDGWSGDASISRLRYISMRGKVEGREQERLFEGQERAFETVIADGAGELIKILQSVHLQARSMVVIVARDADSQEFEDLSNALKERGFLQADGAWHLDPGGPPSGVSVGWRARP